MKKASLLLIVKIFLCSFSFAQQFILLHTDPQDVTNPANLDIKTISYDLDHTKDSVWFKVETYNQAASGNDDNITIAIDNNLNIADGKEWWKSNKSMKYDGILYVFSTNANPTQYYSYYVEGTKTLTNPATIIKPNATTYIIRMQLSAFDTDGLFNFITASGNYDTPQDKAIFDEAPNSGYLSIARFPSTIPNINSASHVRLYPNPAHDNLNILFDGEHDATEILLFDVAGNKIKTLPIEAGKSLFTVPVNTLISGNYFLTIRGAQRTEHRMFIKK